MTPLCQLPLAAVTGDLFAQLLVSGLVLGSAYALIGVSFGVIYGTTRIFHLAHSFVYVGAAYGAALGIESLGLPLPVAALLGLAVGVVLGVGIEIVVYRSVRAAGATTLMLFLASLGVAVVGANLIQIAFGSENRSLPGFPIETIRVGSVTFTTLDVAVVSVAWLSVAAVLIFLRQTRYGRAIDAVRINRTMAEAVGISVGQVYLLVFAIGSLLAATAAVFATMGGVATPTVGFAPILTGFIAVFLGGIGSIFGAALGGLTIGLAASLSGLWLSADLQPAVVFGVLFLVLILRPQGLLGRATS